MRASVLLMYDAMSGHTHLQSVDFVSAEQLVGHERTPARYKFFCKAKPINTWFERGKVIFWLREILRHAVWGTVTWTKPIKTWFKRGQVLFWLVERASETCRVGYLHVGCVPNSM